MEVNEPEPAPRPPERSALRTGLWVGLFLLVSVAAHVALAPLADRWVREWETGLYTLPTGVQFVDADALDAPSMDDLRKIAAANDIVRDENTPEDEEPEPEPEKPKMPDGQIVETPPPDVEKVPLKADYLAEQNNAVPEETRTEKYAINPEVLSNMYSEESKYALENAPDVGATEKSSGATAGNMLDPGVGDKGAPKSLIPSQWQLTNKPGLEAPTIASLGQQTLSGAPQNDLLKERVGDAVSLNTIELIGAQYLNRIRRQVNFYWSQNIDNLPSSVRLSAPVYETDVRVTLDGNGALDNIVVTRDSGNGPMDECVVQAFKIAGPFPNPPAELIAKDGRVYLPDFDFTVQVGHAQMQYQGVDPRAGVQFPGIMKAPR